MATNKLKRLQQAIEPLKHQLANHPLYKEIITLDDLKIFMEHHVFAVWDFMSVLKVLQQKLTYMHIPWIPYGNANTRYLINQIVLEEESDLDIEGNRISHFELYLAAMEQVGCNTLPIKTLMANLQDGKIFSEALNNSNIPSAAKSFIKNTVETSIASNKIYTQATVFTFARRDLLPEMLVNFVKELNHQNPENISILKYYIDRHGKREDQLLLATEMTEDLCGNDEDKWLEATYAVIRCLHARIQLWDSILHKIRKNNYHADASEKAFHAR
jgi:hypothetical protein